MSEPKSEGEIERENSSPSQRPSYEIVWEKVAVLAYHHMAAIYGAYLLVTGQAMWQTLVWTLVLHTISAFGITAGTHRYWAHRSFKAKTPLRIILIMAQTLAYQLSVYEWVRDHRAHHKFTETNADPHNALRGFFFAHMGWLMVRKHPDIKKKGQTIDISDLENDRLVMFQKKYYLSLSIFACFVLPAFVPWCFWGESGVVAWFVPGQLRVLVIMHLTWLVNSAAHLWGSRPFDRWINPAENKLVSLFAMGEGWHNYHHVFPWDYKAAELSVYRLNLTSLFIDFFAWIGWAYSLKTVPPEIVRQRVLRTGDGSHERYSRDQGENDKDPAGGRSHSHGHISRGAWGWGDKDIVEEDAKVTLILHEHRD